MSAYYLFAYGSLINKRSREQTLRNSNLIQKHVRLRDHVRKMNAPYKDGYLYLNLVHKDGASVYGSVLAISDTDAPILAKREEGSQLQDITAYLDESFSQPVFAYMQPDCYHPAMKVMQSYINTCMQSVPLQERTQWLHETIIENEIEDDSHNPLYEFSA